MRVNYLKDIYRMCYIFVNSFLELHGITCRLCERLAKDMAPAPPGPPTHRTDPTSDTSVIYSRRTCQASQLLRVAASGPGSYSGELTRDPGTSWRRTWRRWWWIPRAVSGYRYRPPIWRAFACTQSPPCSPGRSPSPYSCFVTHRIRQRWLRSQDPDD